MGLFKRTGRVMGLDLTGKTIRAGLFSPTEKGCCLETCAGGTLPDGLMVPAFTGENIRDPGGLAAIIKKTLSACGYQGGPVHVSLPDETIKMRVQSFQELPQDAGEKRDLVRWTVGRNLSVPVGDLALSWQEMGRDGSGRQILLLLMAQKSVLAAYREILKQAGINPVGLGPTALNRFNSHARRMDVKETMMYLGLSRRFVTLAGFSGGVPLFFNTVRRGFLGPGSRNTGNDIALVVDYCLSLFGENTLFLRLYVACYGVDYRHARALFPEKGITQTRTLAPEGIITQVRQIDGQPVTGRPAMYAAAAGAVAGAMGGRI